MVQEFQYLLYQFQHLLLVVSQQQNQVATHVLAVVLTSPVDKTSTIGNAITHHCMHVFSRLTPMTCVKLQSEKVQTIKRSANFSAYGVLRSVGEVS